MGSRDNFFVKANVIKPNQQGKERETVQALIQLSNIDVIMDNDKTKGCTIMMMSGAPYEVVETREHFIKSGAAYGVAKEIGL